MSIGDGRKTYSDSTLKSMTKDKQVLMTLLKTVIISSIL